MWWFPSGHGQVIVAVMYRKAARFDELCNLETYSQSGYRCVSLATPAASRVFLDSDVPRFEEFVGRLRDIVAPGGAIACDAGSRGSQSA